MRARVKLQLTVRFAPSRMLMFTPPTWATERSSSESGASPTDRSTSPR